MSNVYGSLILGEEAHAQQVAITKATSAGVYGTLITGLIKAPVDPTPVAVELPSSPLGDDYTVQQLVEALFLDPSLAEAMLVAEMARPTGARKMALRAIIEHTTDPAVTTVATDALDGLLAG